MIEAFRYTPALLDFWNTDLRTQTHRGEYLNIAYPLISPMTIEKVDEFDISYFTQGSVVSSKKGVLESDSVVYVDPITGYQHEFNAVQHGSLEGSVFLNATERTLYPAKDRGRNYWTASLQKYQVPMGTTLVCPDTDLGRGPVWNGFFIMKPFFLGDLGLSQGAGTMRVVAFGLAYASVNYYTGNPVADSDSYINFQLRSCRVPGPATASYSLRYTKSFDGTTYGRKGFEPYPYGARIDESRIRDWFEAEVAKIISQSGSFINEAGFNVNLSGYSSTSDVAARVADGRILDMRFVPDISLDKLKSFDFRNFIVDTPVGLWNELSNEALEGLKGFDGNGIAFVKDAKELLPTVTGFLKSCRDVLPRNYPWRSKKRYTNIATGVGFDGNYKISTKLTTKKLVKRKHWSWMTPKQIKALSDAYLGMHYGLKLTYSDTKDLLEELQDLPGNFTLSRVQSARSFQGRAVGGNIIVSASTTARYQIFYDPSEGLKHPVASLIQQLDLFPTFENIWDMVPFSFVVDWFLDLQDSLNAVDNSFALNRSHYEVAACGQSLKSTFVLDQRALGLNSQCNVHGTMYTRRYKDYAETPLPGDSSPTSPLHHWVEGTALIVSNN